MDRITLSDSPSSVFEPLFNETEDCGCGCQQKDGCGDNKNTNIITIHGQGATQNRTPEFESRLPYPAPVTHNTMMTAYPPIYPAFPQYEQGLGKNNTPAYPHGFSPRIPEKVFFDDSALQQSINEVRNGLSRLITENQNNAHNDKELSKTIKEQQRLLQTLQNRAAQIKYVEKKIPYYIDRPVPVIQKEINYIDRPVPAIQEKINYVDRPVLTPQKEIQYVDRPVIAPQKQLAYVDRPVLTPQKEIQYVDRPVITSQKQFAYVDRPVPVIREKINYVDRPVLVTQKEPAPAPAPRPKRSFQQREFA